MSDGPQMEVKPIARRWLAALTIGAFLIVFLASEALDPRWLTLLRSPPSPTPVPTSLARAVRPVPTARARSSGSPAAAASPGASPVASPEPEPAPMELVVVFAGDVGARLRASPSADGAVEEVVSDGATVVWLGAESTSQGRRWLEVQTSAGLRGWMPADLLALRDAPRTP